MADDDKKPYHERYRPAPPPDYMRYLTAPFTGYWDRQGKLAREGLAMAEDGAQRTRAGDLSGYLGQFLGPIAYASSPINALIPTEEEAYAAFDSNTAPFVAGGLGLASAMLPGPKGMGKLPTPKPTEGITAYHGSPHTFDKFSMDKIGTGEGAQAYGHGLYFAESPGVAKSYRDKLAPSDASMAKPDDIAVKEHGSQWAALVQERRAAAGPDGRGDTSAVDDRMDALHARMVADSVQRTPSLAGGSMYQVRINAKPEEFLDWDRPLSEQTHLHEALKGAGASVAGSQDAAGSVIKRAIASKYHAADLFQGGQGELDITSAGVSERLKAAGIKGVRYQDQGSRGTEGGTYNYVVFDDKIVEILKRYGIPFTLGAGGAAMVSGGDMPPEVAAQMGPQA